jgi:hypothetical protein
MKWMGGWTEQDYDESSPEIISTIIELINEEQEYLESLKD